MKDLNDLRRHRAALAAVMTVDAQALAAAEGEALVAAQAKFAQGEADFKAADVKVKAGESAEAAMALAAVGDTKIASAAPAMALNPADKGVDLGLITIALINAKGDQDKAANLLEKAGYSGLSASLNTGSSTAGGVVIPQAMAENMIELLRPNVVVRKAGAQSVPMPAGQLRYAKQTASATASYGGEIAPITPSEPTTGYVDQSFKTLTAMVPVSNALLTFGPRTGALVRNDLLAVMAAKEDATFLLSAGSTTDPKGMWAWMPSANKQTSVANGFAVVDVALRKMVSKVVDSDVPMLAGGWVMRRGTREFLASLKNAAGLVAYPSIDAAGTLMGYPIYTTSQIPSNLGAGTNETQVMFADFSELMIGDAGQTTMAMSTEASYVVGGVTVSAFQTLQTLIRVVSLHDFAPKHDVAIAGAQVVAWAL